MRWRSWRQLWWDWRRDEHDPLPAVRLFAASPIPTLAEEGRWVDVVQVDDETQDTRSFWLKARDGADLAGQPGQFLTLLLQVEGSNLRRAYSISAVDPVRNWVRLTVKRTPTPRVSAWMQEHLKVGNSFRVLGPDGHCTLKGSVQKRQLLCIAAGSGITPIHRMISWVLSQEPDSRILLIDANRHEEDRIFASSLEALSKQYPDRFSIRWSLSQPGAGWRGGKGRLDAARLGRLLRDWPLADSEVVLCGPEGFMEMVASVLRQKGLPEQHLKQEHFQTAQVPEGQQFLPRPIKVWMHGHCVQGETAGSETLLETGLRLGVAMPHSCTLGGCGRCRVRVRQGAAWMPEPNGLMPSERAEGFVLACQAHALKDLEIEVDPPREYGY